MGKNNLEHVLSESDDDFQKEITEKIVTFRQIRKGFDEICEVMDKVESDELTIKEGQTKIDIITKNIHYQIRFAEY